MGVLAQTIPLPASPSQYLQSILHLDDGRPINFQEYRAYQPLIDLPLVEEVDFYTGRQVGKSSFLTMNIVKYGHIPWFRISYVAPTEMQMTDYSRMKLGLSLKNSPDVARLLMSPGSPLVPKGVSIKAADLLNDVRLKVFATLANVKLSYANDAVGVHRIRGNSADMLLIDESQSVDLDSVLPVIEPILDSSDYAIKMFTGTPIDENDPLSIRFLGSSQHTMVVKCEHCGKYTTLMHVKQIRPQGVSCFFCDKIIDISKGKFVPMNPGSSRLGFHINKLMFPGWVANHQKWSKLVRKVQDPNSDISKIYMEDLGVPVSVSTRLLSKLDVMNCGTMPGYDPDHMGAAYTAYRNSPAYSDADAFIYSIDWGGGANDAGSITARDAGSSRTVTMLWAVRVENNRTRMRLVHHKVYPLANVKTCIERVIENLKVLPSHALIVADYLGGAYGNSSIWDYVKGMPHKHHTFIACQLTEHADILVFSELRDRVSVDRNRLLTKFFRKVLQREIHFPKDTALLDEIAQHFLAEVEMRNEIGKSIWRKRRGTVDDLLFAGLFAWIMHSICYDKQEELLI